MLKKKKNTFLFIVLIASWLFPSQTAASENEDIGEINELICCVGSLTSLACLYVRVLHLFVCLCVCVYVCVHVCARALALMYPERPVECVSHFLGS